MKVSLSQDYYINGYKPSPLAGAEQPAAVSMQNKILQQFVFRNPSYGKKMYELHIYIYGILHVCCCFDSEICYSNYTSY